MEPNEPAFYGRRAIQTHYSIVMNAGANRLGLVTTGLWGDEKMLAEEGEFTFMDKRESRSTRGNILFCGKRRKENGNFSVTAIILICPFRNDL